MYYIYHIPGVKIGCTQRLRKRTKVQGFINYQILEEHIDVYIASDREIALQKQYGLPVDKVPYWQTIKMSSRGGRAALLQKKGIHAYTKEELIKVAIEGGKTMGNTCYEKKIGIFGMDEHIMRNIRSNAGKIGGNTNKLSGQMSKLGSSGVGGKISVKIERTCPHCNKTMKGNIYFKWHGDNCKAKPN
jgi:hypothetical protein